MSVGQLVENKKEEVARAFDNFPFPRIFLDVLNVFPAYYLTLRFCLSLNMNISIF